MIQISNHIMSKSTGIDRFCSRIKLVVFQAAFGQNKLFIRKLLSYQIKRLKMISTVPMKCRSGNHAICRRIDQIAGSFKNTFLVVIPYKDLYMLQTGLLHHRV